MDASESYSKRLNAKEVIFSSENGKIFIQSEKNVRGDQEFVKTTPQKTRFLDDEYARIWDTD